MQVTGKLKENIQSSVLFPNTSNNLVEKYYTHSNNYIFKISRINLKLQNFTITPSYPV